MKKLKRMLKVIHEQLTEALAEFPAIMWVALFLDCLLILYMVLLAVDGIVFPSRMTTLRMVMGGYGVVNAIFLAISGYFTCDDFSLVRDPPREDRLTRYEKVIAPMLVLFPSWHPCGPVSSWR